MRSVSLYPAWFHLGWAGGQQERSPCLSDSPAAPLTHGGSAEGVLGQVKTHVGRIGSLRAGHHACLLPWDPLLPCWGQFGVSAVVCCAGGLSHSMGDMRGWCCRVTIVLD